MKKNGSLEHEQV